jgi:hypothetical protein
LTDDEFVSLSPPERGEGGAKRQERGAFEKWPETICCGEISTTSPDPLSRFAAERGITGSFAGVPVIMIKNRITIKIGNALKNGCANGF